MKIQQNLAIQVKKLIGHIKNINENYIKSWYKFLIKIVIFAKVFFQNRFVVYRLRWFQQLIEFGFRKKNF